MVHLVDTNTPQAVPQVVKVEHVVTDATKDYKNGSRIDQFVWWASGIFVRRTLSAFSCVFGFIMFIVVIVIATNNAGNSEEQTHAWDMNSDIHVQQLDILDNLRDNTDLIAVDYKTRQVALTGTSLFMMYEANDGKDILTAANLQRMCEAEKFYFNSEHYTDFCVVATGVDCPATPAGQAHSSCACADPALTVVGLFYGNSDLSWATSTDNACPLLGEDAVKAQAAQLYASLGTSDGLQTYGFYVGSDFNKKGYSSRARSLLQVGGPLEGFTVTLDDEPDQDGQSDRYQDYFEAVQDELIEMLDMEAGFMRSLYRSDTALDGKVELVWFSPLLTENVFEELINGDLTMVVFSVLFVYFWMNVHIESFFIASMAMLQIVLSLTFSRLFYSIMAQIWYFSTLQSLVIFLILGIGADDVFVLVDAWVQSEKDVVRVSGEEDEEWLHRRLASSYSRTISAVFNTSFTTAMAFMSTAFSPVMPISAFGIYATICIVVNYLFVISLTPAVILIHHKHFGGFGPAGWCGINKCFRKTPPTGGGGGGEKDKNSALELTVTTGQTEAVHVVPNTKGSSELENGPPSPSATIGAADGVDSGGEGLDDLKVDKDTELVSRVLIATFEYELRGEQWPQQVQGLKVFSLLSVLGCLAMAAAFAAFAFQLSLPTEPEQWFPKDHMVQRFTDMQPDFLLSEEGSYPVLNLVWGAKPHVQRPDFNHWKADKNRGEAQPDKNFDLANPAAFEAVKGACELLRTKVCKAKGCKPVGMLVQPNSVTCAVDEFESWHVTEYTSKPQTLFATGNSALFYSRLLEFRANVAPASDPYGTWEDLIGVVGGKLSYLVVTGDMTMDLDVPNTVKKDVLELCIDLISDIDKPDSAHHVLQVSQVWNWYATQDAIVSGMLLGLAIAFPVAFCTLIFATQNVIIALYAIIAIAAIVLSVLGSAQQQGWSLGIAESIAAVIVVGFSVDYTIHLGHMYDHAGHEGFAERGERARFAILKMGSTVLAGAITTAGAGVFLFGCQLVFFNKMAFLIVLTIVYSLVFSLFFFVPALYLAGPHGTCGHVSTLVPGSIKDKIGIQKK